MKRILSLALLSTLALAPAALADRREVQHYPDGSVIAEGRYYSSVVEWQRSDQFQSGGHRCASGEGLDLEMLRMLADPSDCSFSSTTIDPEYEAATGITYRIPTVIHVITTTGGTGNLPQPLVESQIDVLNEDFQAIMGTNGENGYNTKFEFILVDEEPDGTPTDGVYYYTNNTWFNDPGPGAPNPMKQALAWDTTKYLNVYSNDAAGNLGYATFPQTSAGTINDGIVLHHSTVGFLNPNGGVYNLGRSGTHEIGHWLGLFHTFEGSCSDTTPPDCYQDPNGGDLICDTPSQQSPQFGCPTTQTSCGGILSDYANYMNYTDDACMERFTQEQSNRMRCSFVNYRPEMLIEVIFEGDFESGDLSAWSSFEG